MRTHAPAGSNRLTASERIKLRKFAEQTFTRAVAAYDEASRVAAEFEEANCSSEAFQDEPDFDTAHIIAGERHVHCREVLLRSVLYWATGEDSNNGLSSLRKPMKPAAVGFRGRLFVACLDEDAESMRLAVLPLEDVRQFEDLTS